MRFIFAPQTDLGNSCSIVKIGFRRRFSKKTRLKVEFFRHYATVWVYNCVFNFKEQKNIINSY